MSHPSSRGAQLPSSGCGAAAVVADRRRQLLERTAEVEALRTERDRLLDALVHAEEAERARIAREVHDDSLQAMYAVGLRLQRLAHGVSGRADLEALDCARETLEAAIRRLRHLAFELHPPAGAAWLGDALRSFLSEILADAPVEWDLVDEGSGKLPPELVVTLYRLAQEAVTNAVRHSGASWIRLRLRRAGASVSLEIRDDGRGVRLEPAPGRRSGGLGLVAMRERIEIAGGTMRLESGPGRGTTVAFHVPLPVAPTGPCHRLVGGAG